MNDLEKRARTTFWQALVGVCTCCGPLGVFALLKALGVKREAERASERVPRFAYIAIALGALSCIEFAAAVVAGYQAQQKRDATVERAQSRMSGKLVKSRYTIRQTSPTSYSYKWEITGEDGAWQTILMGKSITRVIDCRIGSKVVRPIS